jgi:hypothetical protein
MQEKQILSRINKAEQRIVDLYKKLTSGSGGRGNSGYDIYQVLISYSKKFGTQSAVEIQNTLGVTPTWNFLTDGVAKAIIPGGWTPSETGVDVGPLDDQSKAVGSVKGYETDKNTGISQLIITALGEDGKPTSEAFNNTLVTIIIKK